MIGEVLDVLAVAGSIAGLIGLVLAIIGIGLALDDNEPPEPPTAGACVC